MNIKPNLDRIVIGYCRVSSNKQKDDLERQIENMRLYLTAQGKPFEIISDIGSGINYKKKGLKELIEEGDEENDKNNPGNVTSKQ